MAGFRYKARDLSLGGVLINSLCHGACHEETPSPDDLMSVCKETPVVVERFAAGQLELIRGGTRLRQTLPIGLPAPVWRSEAEEFP